MRTHFLVCVLLIVCYKIFTNTLVSEKIGYLSRPFRRCLQTLSTSVKFEFLSELRNTKIQKRISDSQPFPCNVSGFRSVEKPVSVHKLKPGDIDVIAAFGDSVTAGIGLTAATIFEELEEERGKVFSSGGEATWREFLTLPNILKEFNPKLRGYANQNALSIDPASELNVGEICALSEDMSYMAQQLITRFKLKKEIDISQDWKMITILIGFNNFCGHMCFEANPEDIIERHRNDMIQLFRILKDNLPRTIINIVTPPNLKMLVESKIVNTTFCPYFRLIACPCLIGMRNLNNRSYNYDIMSKWQQVDIELAEIDEFDTDDFTIVLQPLFLNYTLPKLNGEIDDLDYFASDCFHWSQKFHAKVANELWNNMMEPVGNKTTTATDLFSRFLCPTEEHPYIFTRRNSN